ncbi:Aste57867_15376 [Aphanomyces stellatus]|uniref:Aste57867_15376 protein n=1 Tax=Aphanomyces stellatus TaxID=120398 RepID=A0A485L304_9STRA|nr:hypothetical protein As57867_015320 [Aphanomyces stellatus]VFT92182.1 Aste57867_15376 [Aphanomyces stellatus]
MGLILRTMWGALCVFLVYLDARMIYIGISSIAFQGARLILPWLSDTFVPAYRRGEYELTTPEKKYLWCNTAVSLLHSALSSSASLAVLCLDMSPHPNWIHACSPLAILCLSLSTGYFIYDFYDLVVFRLYLKAPVILFHHVMVAILYLAAIYCCVSVPYLVVLLLVEVSSIFLHLRKLLSLAGFTLRNSRLYARSWQALWFTFAVTRVAVPLAVHMGVYRDRALFPETYQFAMAFLGTALLHVLNVFVLQGCWKAYRKECHKRSSKDA